MKNLKISQQKLRKRKETVVLEFRNPIKLTRIIIIQKSTKIHQYLKKKGRKTIKHLEMMTRFSIDREKNTFFPLG